jgi:predicted naringenin-chalcone synthase
MSLAGTSPFQLDRRETLTGILGIGTASPMAVTQEQLLQLAIEVGRPTPNQQLWLTRLFRGSGIQTRGTVLAGASSDVENSGLEEPFESVRKFYPPAIDAADGGPTTETRMLRYAAEAPAMAASAAGDALSQSQTSAAEITHLFTASCTGFMAPGLDCALIERLALSRHVHRLHIGFMGCHAAFNLLAAARDVVRADSNARVLVCCVELCSLHMAYGWNPGKLVANALFADGAAAAVIGQSSDGDADAWEVSDTASMLIPNSQEAMTWRIGNRGFEMTLSPGVPNLIREHLRPWCENWLARHGLIITDITSWAIHPGGPKILDAVGNALDLPSESLSTSRQILARHGNMSSATILFILQKMLQDPPDGPCVAIGLGPGLMVEGLLLNG